MNTQHAMKSLVLALALPAGALFAGNGKDTTIAEIAKTCTVKGQDTFHGFDRVTFDFKGHEAWIVFPKDGKAREGKPWTWTMQWATAFVPRTHVPQMLADGYHHVTIDTFRHRMDEEGLALSAAFQKYLVEALGFAPKANLIGMSWGGFFSVRYAATYPENVRKIYLDCPFLNLGGSCLQSLDIGSWSASAPENWLDDPRMPVNMARAVAEARIPILLAYGGADNVLSPKLNSEVFIPRFKAAGGDIKVVYRAAYGHHPHGFEVNETTIKDFFDSEGVKPVASFPGEANAKTGWKLVASEEGKVVYIPFEGYYESKGGRIESPRFPLDKEIGENAYYRLTFAAKSDVDGYWWVDFYDKAGNLLPDVNSRLYALEDWQDYDVMVPACPDAAEAVIAFVSKKGAFVKDVTMRQASLDEAVAWCGKLYGSLPKLGCAAANDCWSKLPNARTALKVAKNYNVVLLGDSIMNDSYCGLLTAIAQKAFPDTKIRFDISVRGSTGCWYYHEKEHFDEYVAKYKPNLVLIGGISNYPGSEKLTLKEAEDYMVETIERCKAIGAEVVVCTPPKSVEFRKSPEPKELPADFNDEATAADYLQLAFERRAAARTGVQLWDLNGPTCRAVALSGKPLGWFNRDFVHNDDRGKQLIAQMFGEYFRAAWR